MKKTRYKFLGTTVYQFDVMDGRYLRAFSGPFTATVEPVEGRKCMARLSFTIPGQERHVPIPYEHGPFRHPKQAIAHMEQKAKETARATARALRVA